MIERCRLKGFNTMGRQFQAAMPWYWSAGASHWPGDMGAGPARAAHSARVRILLEPEPMIYAPSARPDNFACQPGFKALGIRTVLTCPHLPPWNSAPGATNMNLRYSAFHRSCRVVRLQQEPPPAPLPTKSKRFRWMARPVTDMERMLATITELSSDVWRPGTHVGR
jgi:hypothetical protein